MVWLANFVHYLNLHVPCFEIFPVSFGFPEFYSTASLDVLVKLCLVVTKLGFIQVCISENQNEYSKPRSRMSKITNMMSFWLSPFLDVNVVAID